MTLTERRKEIESIKLSIDMKEAYIEVTQNKIIELKERLFRLKGGNKKHG